MSGSLYFFALIGALGLCVIGSMLARRPKRPCPRCDEQISMAARRCLHCGYEFE